MNWGAVPFVAAFFVLGFILLAVRRPMGRYAHRTYSETGPRSWAKTEDFWTSFTVGSVVILWIVGVVLFFVLVM
jgi:hypothetical protein